MLWNRLKVLWLNMCIQISLNRSRANTYPAPLPEPLFPKIFLINFLSPSSIGVVILLIHILGVNILEWISDSDTLTVHWISSISLAWHRWSAKRLRVLLLRQCWVVVGPRLAFQDILVTLLWVVQVYSLMSWLLIVGLQLVYLRLVIFQMLNTFSSR